MPVLHPWGSMCCRSVMSVELREGSKSKGPGFVWEFSVVIPWDPPGSLFFQDINAATATVFLTRRIGTAVLAKLGILGIPSAPHGDEWIDALWGAWGADFMGSVGAENQGRTFLKNH